MADEGEVKMYCGTCPDSHCGNLLYFIPNVLTKVECTKCGQHHEISSLLNVKQTDGTSAALGSFLKSMLCNYSATKKGSELVKVRGLSNYHCKLISPLLTSYGMDKSNGEAKLLSELGQPEIFDCSVLANRAFLIEKDHLEIDGYGKDKTGSLMYLENTLELIDEGNNHKSSLIPLHADGDGHCLVHAISRAVVGRELLWHSLRQNLRTHLEEKNKEYQALFCDFIDNNEWYDIIAEADPDFTPATNEPFGLRNIHVFGLANVLHRPIVLLDSIEGMQSSGDYSGIFLPAFLAPEQCKTKDMLNKPLVIAWSSSARNHYVPLVGIKGAPLPKIHQSLLPKAWGTPNETIPDYIDFDENGYCEIGGSRSLPESYIDRLVSAMDTVFFQKYQVSPQLVADVNQFICKPSNAEPMSLEEVAKFTHNTVLSKQLYRCIMCQAVKECEDDVPQALCKPGGKLYKMLEETETGLIPDTVYGFKEYGLFIYNAQEDALIPLNSKNHTCDLCKGVLREVCANGTVKYVNGDCTLTTSESTNGCMCGYKHYWDGEEYDNLPKRISAPLEWGGKKVDEEIFWFDKESDPSLNSNAYELATTLVQKHFPGEFGSEVLVRKVVDKILRETAVKQNEEKEGLPPINTGEEDPSSAPPTKIILTGPKKKTLHKEELNKSDAEKMTKARISHHAAFSQKRKSASVEKLKGNMKQGKQEMAVKTKEAPRQAATSDTTAQPLRNQTQPASNGPPGNTGNKKIRLSSSDGRQSTVTLSSTATYSELQEAILKEFRIAKDKQKLRYGFPPRELSQPEDESSALPLSHGDRVSVEELRPVVEQEEKSSSVDDSAPVEKMETTPEKTGEIQESGGPSEEFNDTSREQFTSELMNLLRGALNVDHWETMQHQPELFAHGGRIYEQVVHSMGQLQDDEHLSILELPGKRFAYNAKEDRLELCLGKKHIPVQPLDAETTAEAQNTNGGSNPKPSSRPDEGIGSFSGAVKHRSASEGRSAFSGAGRALGGTSEQKGNEENIEITQEAPGNNPSMDVVSTENVVPVDGTTKTTTVSGEKMMDVERNEDDERMIVDEGPIREQSNNVEVDNNINQEQTSVAHEEIKDAHETVEGAHETMEGAHETMEGAHETMEGAHGIEKTDLANKGTIAVHEETSIAQQRGRDADDEMRDMQGEIKETHGIENANKATPSTNKPVVANEKSQEMNVSSKETNDERGILENANISASAANATDVAHEISNAEKPVAASAHDVSAMKTEGGESVAAGTSEQEVPAGDPSSVESMEHTSHLQTSPAVEISGDSVELSSEQGASGGQS